MARLIKGPETDQHLKAFELYYGMGSSRSLPALAKEVGMSETAVKGWSRTFNWTKRIEDRDQEVAHELNRKAAKIAATRKMAYLDTINIGMEQFAEGLRNNTIQVRSVGDAEKLVNMYMKLIGETQIHQTNVMVVTAADIIKAEKQVRDVGGTTLDIDLSDYSISDAGEVDSPENNRLN
jgi:hypothetical protein